jgi:hypothetical protein
MFIAAAAPPNARDPSGARRRKAARRVNLRSAIAGTGGARAHARTGVVSCKRISQFCKWLPAHPATIPRSTKDRAMTDTLAPTRTRSGGRAARRTLRRDPRFHHAAGPDTGPAGDCEVMDGAEVELIDAASMDILEKLASVFRDPIALEDWKRWAPKVRGRESSSRPRAVRDLIATIPADFLPIPANPRQQREPRRQSFGLRADDRRALPARPRRCRRNPTLDDLAMFHKLIAHGCRHCIQAPIISSSRWTTDQPPAPAHHLFLDETLRQDVHGHDDEPEERRGRDGDVRDPVRR